MDKCAHYGSKVQSKIYRGARKQTQAHWEAHRKSDWSGNRRFLNRIFLTLIFLLYYWLGFIHCHFIAFLFATGLGTVYLFFLKLSWAEHIIPSCSCKQRTKLYVSHQLRWTSSHYFLMNIWITYLWFAICAVNMCFLKRNADNRFVNCSAVLWFSNCVSNLIFTKCMTDVSD